MAIGINEDQIKALVMFIYDDKDKNNLESRKDKLNKLDKLKGFLLNGPKKGNNISNFQIAVNRTNDGKTFYYLNYLLKKNKITIIPITY